MAKPTPDWDLVTLKWAGVYLDGTPARGSLHLDYNGTVMLDDDPELPINIFRRRLTAQLTTTQIMIDGQQREVGYAEFQVPASNDPDITGGGGTYTLTEELVGGGGRGSFSFVADIAAPNRTIWLNKILPTAPSSGQVLPVVYFADFEALEQRVTAVETGGTGGVSSWNELTDKPPTFPPSTHSHSVAQVTGLQTALDGKAPVSHTHTADKISDSTPVGRSVITAADAAAARAALGAGTSNLALGATSSTAKAGDYQPTWSQVTGKPATFAPTVGTTSTTAKAGDYTPPVADLPAGVTLTVINIDGTQERPTLRSDIFVRWVGGTVAPANGMLGDVWEKDVTE